MPRRIRYLLISIIILGNSCAKEKTLNKSNFPDNGEIFLSGYINNNGDNQISIYGKNLLEIGIKLYIDTGYGFQELPIVYNHLYFQYDCSLKHIHFQSGKDYLFKILSIKYADSLIFKEALPEDFTPIISVNYPNPTEFYATLKLKPNIINPNEYTHDINYSGFFGDTINQNMPLYGNLYFSKNLPHILNLDGNTQSLAEVEKMNELSLLQGIRIPHYSMFNSECNYVAVTQKIKFSLTRFYFNDFEYIKSISENILNIGNPFFLNYQLKNIEKSQKNKIYGIIVGTNISKNNSIVIHDKSDTAIKIYIKYNGTDIIGNTNYKTSILEYKNIEFKTLYLGDNFWYFSSSILKHLYSKCQKTLNKENEILIQFNVYDKINKKTKTTNKIIFKLTQTPIVLNFEVL